MSKQDNKNEGVRTRRGKDMAVQGTLGAAPIFVLVEPQMGENIGAAARAMLNFGIRGLRLVSPRDGWPNPAASAMAAGAGAVIDNVRLFDSVSDAVADCTYVLATTARPRELRLPVFEPREAASALLQRLSSAPQTRERCAILFGGERSGLTSEDVARADAILTIPVNPAFASLNLAQAVLIMAYEWGQCRAGHDGGAISGFASPLASEPRAERIEFDRLMAHLEAELEASGFFYPLEKKPLMMRNLSAALIRSELTQTEIQTLRGVVKALSQGRGMGGRGMGGHEKSDVKDK